MNSRAFTLIILVSALYTVANAQNEEKPGYSIMSKLDNRVEIRDYSPSKWACTSSSASRMIQDTSMFFNLFYYIQGRNDQNQKMPMTAPVISWFEQGKTSGKKTMCFYLPKAYQNNTPNPTNANVFLKSVPDTVFATIQFGGFASTSDYTSHQATLVKTLGTDVNKYDTTLTIMAGYNSPYTLFNRTNEVWIRSK